MADKAKKTRKTYQPPTLDTSTLYERSSLACGKTPGRGQGRRRCRGNPRVS